MEEGARIRVRAPEVKDMDIDEALEEVWGTVGARKGSNRSNVFFVHFDNGKSKECQKDWIEIHLRNETQEDDSEDDSSSSSSDAASTSEDEDANEASQQPLQNGGGAGEASGSGEAESSTAAQSSTEESAQQPTKRKSKCGNCGQPGHYKKKCPTAPGPSGASTQKAAKKQKAPPKLPAGAGGTIRHHRLPPSARAARARAPGSTVSLLSTLQVAQLAPELPTRRRTRLPPAPMRPPPRDGKRWIKTDQPKRIRSRSKKVRSTVSYTRSTTRIILG